MITVNKANPSQGEITSSLTGSTGDGAGLHFDGSAGALNFTPPDFGTKFSFEFVIKADSYDDPVIKIIDFGVSGDAGRFAFGTASATSYNLGIYDNSNWVSFGVKVLDDLKVHHLTLTVDGTAAVLYDNGNQVATATISASHNIDATNDAAISAFYAGSANFFEGTIYRARFWNKVVDAKALYERADVDFADQYGSASNLVAYDFSNWTSTSNSTNVNATTQNVTSTGGWWRKVYSLNAGFKHRIRLVGTQQSGQNFFIRDYDGSATALTDITNTTGTVSAAGLVEGTSFDITATYTPDSNGYMLQGGAGTGNIAITTFEVHQIGCVSDYDLAFANPTQSLTVQDRSGAADGTASTSGVTQVQPVVQLNATAARIGTSAATPADGQIIGQHIVAGDSTDNNAWFATKSTAGYYSGIKMTRGAGTFADDANNNFGFIVTDAGLSAAKFTSPDANVTGRGDLLTINSTGQVGIGNSPSTLLHLKSANPVIRLEDSDPDGIYAEVDGAGGDLILSADGGNGDADSQIKFKVDNSIKATIDSTGNVTVGTGGTASAHTKLTIDGTSATNRGPRLEFGRNSTNVALIGTESGLAGNNSDDLFLFAETGHAVKIATGGSTTPRLTIDSTGAVDISGAASGSAALTVGNSTGGTDLEITPTENASITLNASEGATARDLILATGGTPRLTVDSTGYTFFNCSSVPNATVEGFAIYGSSSANVSSSGSSTSSYNHLVIFNGNGQVGSIVSSGSATAYNTSSDYRLKENLEPLTGALDRLDALPVYRFNFKADPDTTVDGFVAHEVSAHVPEAVTGEKDAMKTVVVQEAVEAVEAVAATYWEEGDELPEGVAVGDEKTAAVEAVEAVAEVTEEQPDYQGIDQSKLVPLLVAAVKELKAKVETLENA